MPYERVSDLPDSVRDNLPNHAQEIYQAAFNSAWKQYDTPEERRAGRSREETAHAVAWSAVEQKYEKDAQTGKWVEKDPPIVASADHNSRGSERRGG